MTLGLNLSQARFTDAVQHLVQAARHQRGYVCFANAHMTVEASQNPSFRQAVNHADFVFADGVPLLWTSRFLHQRHQDRVAGMDVMPALLRQAEQQQLAVYFYGSTPETLSRIKCRIHEQYPKLIIADMYSPPFRQQTDQEEELEVSKINVSGAKLVFVALGCPKQEQWMAKHTHKIDALLLGVGGAFPVFAQQQKRAPKWLRNLGLEWTYRLMLEPYRLWKRYAITNTIFAWLAFRAWLCGQK